MAAKAAGGRKGVTSWADSDTESDVDVAKPPPKKLDAFGESESESESESEEEDSEVSFCILFAAGWAGPTKNLVLFRTLISFERR